MSISKNTAYNIAGALVPMLVALATIPLYIKEIGEQRYGVLAIFWLLLGYFGVFDLGLGRAIAQRIAGLPGIANGKKRSEILWTALSMNLVIGLIGGVLLWPVSGYLFEHQFKVDVQIQEEVLRALPWLVLALPAAIISGVLGGAMQGIEKFLLLNVTSTMGSVLFQSVPLFVAWIWGSSLSILIPAAIGARLAATLILFFICKKEILNESGATFIAQEAKKLLRFGGWITISSFVSPVMVMIDRFITATILGPKSVTYYTVPYQLAERTSTLPTAIASALFPRFASLGNSEATALVESSIKVLLGITTPIMAMGIVLAKPLLSIWISAEFAIQSFAVAQILLIGFWINGLARVPHAYLQARGKPNLVAVSHLCEVIPYVLGLYFATKHFGLLGAAFAFSARLFFDFILLAHLSKISRSMWKQIILACAFLAGIFVLMKSGVAQEPQGFSIIAAAVLISSAAWGAFFLKKRFLQLMPKRV